jgi:hypothetical protein
MLHNVCIYPCCVDFGQPNDKMQPRSPTMIRASDLANTLHNARRRPFVYRTSSCVAVLTFAYSQFTDVESGHLRVWCLALCFRAWAVHTTPNDVPVLADIGHYCSHSAVIVAIRSCNGTAATRYDPNCMVSGGSDVCVGHAYDCDWTATNSPGCSHESLVLAPFQKIMPVF